MTTIASEAEIQAAVATARKTCPKLAEGLVAKYAAARLTMDEVQANLFTEMETAQAAAPVLAFASKRRSGPHGDEAA
ncbi:hypothetical protein [Aureimonas psammosilenae]|uniref:hypothetical protein n=1 Tax=Aureimonas psammosilenae TaxID=2495496 RepID=UPI001260BB39|nr:hypothetical protein [Aureimonas psammosilenae]